MIKRLLCFFMIAIFGAGCNHSCQNLVDQASLIREFDAESGEFKLLLDIDRTELPDEQRPIAIFLIPDQVLPAQGYQFGQIWEKIDLQSALGSRVQAALSAESDLVGEACTITDEQTLSGCQIVMVSMMGMVGSCCRYPLAYTASIHLSLPPKLEPRILTAIAIPEEYQDGEEQCIQIVFP